MKLKISHLFHWLYATLMFLPLLMFIPSCLYYGFNEQAVTNNEQIEKIDYYEVDYNQYIGSYGNYHYTQGIDVEADSTGYFHFTGQISNTFVMSRTLDLSVTPLISGHYYYVYVSYGNEPTSLQLRQDSHTGGFTSSDVYRMGANVNNFYFYFNDTSITYDFSVVINVTDLTKMFGSGNEPTLSQISNFGLSPSDYTLSQLKVLEVPTGEYISVSNITSNIEYAWEQTWELPLFQWTKHSFITTPFSYITGLFGLSSDNSINYVFTYFVSISICWLVFDLIMYVPNLAHRWLDRSAIE